MRPQLDCLGKALSGDHDVTETKIAAQLKRWWHKTPAQCATVVSQGHGGRSPAWNALVRMWWAAYTDLVSYVQDGHVQIKSAPRGVVVCVTCGKEMALGDGCQAGHWSNAAGLCRPHRWMWTNVHIQCVQCNEHLSGNKGAYQIYMESEYMAAQLDEIRDARNAPPLTKREMAIVLLLARREIRELEAML